jgi:hypothetical protein
MEKTRGKTLDRSQPVWYNERIIGRKGADFP